MTTCFEEGMKDSAFSRKCVANSCLITTSVTWQNQNILLSNYDYLDPGIMINMMIFM